MDGVTRSNVSGSPLDSVWKRESPWSYLLGELRSTTGLGLSRTLDTTRIKSSVQTIPNPALSNRNYNPAELGCSLFCSRDMTKGTEKQQLQDYSNHVYHGIISQNTD